MRLSLSALSALALVATAGAQNTGVPVDATDPPEISIAEQKITEACLAFQENPSENPNIIEEAIAEEILKAMPLSPGEAAATGIAVGINDSACVCSNPAQVADLTTRLGFSVGRNIGDVEGSAALICDDAGGQMRLVTVPPRLNQIEACIGNTELEALTEAVYERLSSPTGNAMALSTVKFGDECLCRVNDHLDFLTLTIDEAFAEDESTVFGFSRFGVDLAAAGCIPRTIIENTDERIVDPASPN